MTLLEVIITMGKNFEWGYVNVFTMAGICTKKVNDYNQAVFNKVIFKNSNIITTSVIID